MASERVCAEELQGHKQAIPEEPDLDRLIFSPLWTNGSLSVFHLTLCAESKNVPQNVG